MFENDLFVSTLCVDPEKNTGVKDFVEELQKRYIRQIIFNPGTSITDITLLVDLLNTEPEAVSDQDGAALILLKNGAKDISIIEYYSPRHLTLDQETLINLTNSDIFRFFIDDEVKELNPEQARALYELLKTPNLTCELIKIAAQYLIREEKTQLSENKIIPKILKKIKQTTLAMEISEEKEVRDILRDILTSFDQEKLFDIAFENPEDQILEYTQILSLLPRLLGPEQTAELLAKKVSTEEHGPENIAQAKQVLGKLFTSRQGFLSFLPLLKDELSTKIREMLNVDRVFNELSTAYAATLALDDDVELSLGALSTTERSDIVDGLNTMKTVLIDIEKIKESVTAFKLDPSYIQILQALLKAEPALDVFQKVLNKLISVLGDYLEKDDFAHSQESLAFLIEQVSPNSSLKPEYSTRIINSPNKLPSPLMEKFIIKAIFKMPPDEAQTFLRGLFSLLKEKLPSMLVKIYVHQDQDAPHKEFLQQVLRSEYSSAILRFDGDLRTEPSANVTKIIGLFQGIQGDGVLPLLWEISFHEDLILAQRALKMIAERHSNKSVELLLKATRHSNVPLRFLSIEHLSRYKYKDVISRLALIARGEEPAANSNATIEIRSTAIGSLLKLDQALAKKILLEILNKKLLFVFPLEPKKLRLFAKEQLRA